MCRSSKASLGSAVKGHWGVQQRSHFEEQQRSHFEEQQRRHWKAAGRNVLDHSHQIGCYPFELYSKWSRRLRY